MEKLIKKCSKVYFDQLFKQITVDEMGVDEMGVDEIGVDEMGSRRSGNKPLKCLNMEGKNATGKNDPVWGFPFTDKHCFTNDFFYEFLKQRYGVFFFQFYISSIFSIIIATVFTLIRRRSSKVAL